MTVFKKIKVVSFILIYYLKAIYLVRFSKFNKILFRLNKIKMGNDIGININYIFAYERFFAKTFKIEKCLISSICLFYVLKHFGIKCNFIIGINRDNNFKSHSWIETKNRSFLKDPNNKFVQIHKI